jgi:hypothetical protein
MVVGGMANTSLIPYTSTFTAAYSHGMSFFAMPITHFRMYSDPKVMLVIVATKYYSEYNLEPTLLLVLVPVVPLVGVKAQSVVFCVVGRIMECTSRL